MEARRQPLRSRSGARAGGPGLDLEERNRGAEDGAGIVARSGAGGAVAKDGGGEEQLQIPSDESMLSSQGATAFIGMT